MFILLSNSQNLKKVKENSHTVIPNLLMEGTVSQDFTQYELNSTEILSYCYRNEQAYKK